MRPVARILVLLALLPVTPVGAETVVTLPQAFAAAWTRHSLAQTLPLQREAVAARRDAAAAWTPEPAAIEIGGRSDRFNADRGAEEIEFGLALPLWLPGERAAIPTDLDFAHPRRLPRRWVNNGFEGWSGKAGVVWPERAAMVEMAADSLFRHAFLFVGDRDFDPGYAEDYFCFEPMSHLADGHNMADLGGLVVLAPEEELAGSVELRPRRLEGSI